MSGLSRVNMETLKQGMDVKQLDALLAMSPDNFFYVTDALILTQKIVPDRLAIGVLPREGEPTTVVCNIEETQTRRDSWISDIRTYVEFQETPVHALSEVLKERGLGKGRIGIEKHWLAAEFAEEMAELLPGASLVAADRLFDEARAIKTSDELHILQNAALVTERAILRAFQAARPGNTEKKVADGLVMDVMGHGATSFWIVLGAGANSAVAHHYAGPKELNAGDIVRVDVGGIFGGYQSDVARTAIVGTPTEEQQSIYRHLRDAQRQAIAAACPGARACDVYFTCQRALKESGVPFSNPHIGHGLGVGLHEFPMLHPKEQVEIKVGMVLNIEPAVKDSRGFMYHIEDLLVVTKSGPQILTDAMDTQELFVIN